MILKFPYLKKLQRKNPGKVPMQWLLWKKSKNMQKVLSVMHATHHGSHNVMGAMFKSTMAKIRKENLIRTLTGSRVAQSVS